MAKATENTSDQDRAAGTELLTTAQMYRADELAIAGGISGLELMENAGRTCVDAICGTYHPGRAVVLCGMGNNGGDGFVIARLLRDRGWTVRLALATDPDQLTGDAAEMFRRWDGDMEPFEPTALGECDTIVDALFGAGLSRPVEGKVATMIEAANSAGKPIVAIDVPSGIDGTSGAVRGVATKADLTVTFFRKKPGHVLNPGREHCGHIEVADIGIPASVLDDIDPAVRENSPAAWIAAAPALQAGGHKYSRGHVVAVSGHVASTGAARLGARASLRVGAGLVTVASPLDAVAVNAAHLTAIMVKPFDTPADFARILDDRRMNSVLIGPGGGVGGTMRSLVRVALASGAGVVLDADALTSFSDNVEELRDAVAEFPDRPVVVTPHRGEFDRLFGDHAGSEMPKPDRTVAAAEFLGSVVILKGPDTVIASPAGAGLVNTNAPPSLATAGSGDVLAGLVAGLLAQGMAPFEAAGAAVWLHGEAACRFGPGLIAEDLPELIPAALSGIGWQQAMQ